MPPHFEDGAVLLQRMVRMGLVLPAGQDPRDFIFVIAFHMQCYLIGSLRDTLAADNLLGELKRSHAISYPKDAERRLVALIGTTFSNLRRAA